MDGNGENNMQAEIQWTPVYLLQFEFGAKTVKNITWNILLRQNYTESNSLDNYDLGCT